MSATCSVCSVPCTRVCVCGQVRYCSVQCQKQDWARHRDSCPIVSVREITNKGRGLVVNRRISMGQVILAEKPLMLVKFNPPSNPQTEVLKQYKKLNKKQKMEYLGLGHQVNGTGNNILAIFKSNCVSVQISEVEDDWRGIYLQFSKTNHACAYNTVINILDIDREIKLVASRNIQKGEEIVINYLNPYRKKKPSLMLRFERMKSLRNLWNFTCSCDVCSLTGQQLVRNEEIKNNIINLETKQQQFRNIRNMHNAMNSLSLELAIFDLMGKLKDEMIREIPDCLMRCYLYGRVLQIHGVRQRENPDNFRRRAMDIAVKLGDSYVRRIKEREREFDVFISVATGTLVKEKMSRVLEKKVTISLWQP